MAGAAAAFQVGSAGLRYDTEQEEETPPSSTNTDGSFLSVEQ